MNHCDYSHTEVCNDPVEHVMGNSDLRSNVILERINSLGFVSVDPVHTTGDEPFAREVTTEIYE